jgi:hypothetical protein
MANDISGNPWRITTAGTTLKSKVRIKNVLWTGGAAGNVLIIQDNIGRDIIRDVWATGQDHNYGELSWVAGFNVVQIDGGEVLVSIQK